jgi:hypothetical protein
VVDANTFGLATAVCLEGEHKREVGEAAVGTCPERHRARAKGKHPTTNAAATRYPAAAKRG